MSLVVGIDGGGTKTRVCAIDTAAAAGIVITGDASNPISVGWSVASERIIALVEQATAALRSSESPESLDAICAAVAGIDRADQAARLHAQLARRFPGARIEVINDALAALAAGTRGHSGVVLIAGTGTIAVGEDRHGRVMRAGGLGYLIGDEGSGFDIGRHGLLAAAQAAEVRGPETALWQAAQHEFGVAHPVDLVTTIYTHQHPVGVIASFARTVAACADEDAVAGAIMAGAVEQHSRLISSVFGRLDPDVAPTVVLGGGFYAQPSRWLDRLHALQPGRTLARLTYSAAAGAALRAMLLALAAHTHSGSGSTDTAHAKTDTAHAKTDTAHAKIVEAWERIVRGIEGAG